MSRTPNRAFIYNPTEVIQSLRDKDRYDGTKQTRTLMEQAADLLEAMWDDRPLNVPRFVFTMKYCRKSEKMNRSNKTIQVVALSRAEALRKALEALNDQYAVVYQFSFLTVEDYLITDYQAYPESPTKEKN